MPIRRATFGVVPALLTTRTSPERIRPLVDVDPDLAARLSGDAVVRARTAVSVRLFTKKRGVWDVDGYSSIRTPRTGLLIVDGVAAREVVVGDNVSSELLGAGDVVLPWLRCPEHGSAGEQVRWHVLAPLQVAMLDSRNADALAGIPELQLALLERVAIQAERLAALKAFSQINSIDRRLLALFRHLAQRWGRVTPRGLVIPLALSHRLLGELIGARRPSVTSSTTALAREGRLVRRSDGTWLLTEAAAIADADPPFEVSVTAHRRSLTGPRTSLPALRAGAG
jgi:CRP/FNR family cyclic AMP-dependent transcriptional regulator